MLKYFCIMLLCLAIPTCKTVLRWIILAWNIFARVCEMTDCFPSSWSPSLAPTVGLESGCYLRYCTQKGGEQIKVPARSWALLQGDVAGDSVPAVAWLRGQKDRSPQAQPSDPGPSARRHAGSFCLGFCLFSQCHDGFEISTRPPRRRCTMGFSVSDWSGKSSAAWGVPSADSCQCSLLLQNFHCGVLK